MIEIGVSKDAGLVPRRERVQNEDSKGRNAGTMLAHFQDLGLYSKMVRRH